MANFATAGEDASVECANCGAAWNTEFLVIDVGRRLLRSYGFCFLWFDDGAIGVNNCPHCELPYFERETYPWLDQARRDSQEALA